MLRRLGLVVPLAVFVAVLVHLALFGAQHAPGAAHADELLTSLGAALALAALGTVLFAALRRKRDARRYGRPRPGSASPLELTIGGTFAYGLIELTEGHAPFGGVGQLALTIAAALVVWLVARSLGQLLRRSGDALAAFAESLSRSPASLVLATGSHARGMRCAPISGSARGRAPPLFS